MRRGYCVVLGCETGELAVELARQSELMIYAVSPDAEKVAKTARTVDAAGLYGARVCVEQWPLGRVPYSDYFANLIVSETAVAGGAPPPDPAEMFRMLKPLGGVALVGGGAAAGIQRRWRAWLAAKENRSRRGTPRRIPGGTKSDTGVTRGKLAGVGPIEA